MNEKALEIVSQYDLKVQRVSRGRGGMILNTDKGVKLLIECNRPDSYYEREYTYSKALKDVGFECIDGFYLSRDGRLVEENSEDGRKYIIKDWFDGRECDVTNCQDVLKAVATLARLHNCLNIIEVDADRREGESQLKLNYERHTREIKAARNYLKNKKKRGEFEQLALKHIEEFYKEAVRATEKLSNESIAKVIEGADRRQELCHGDFNYHNCIFTERKVAIVNYNKVKRECQILDFYEFMRKILEKYNWNIELAYKMIDEYNKEKTLSEGELELLYALLSYPEKFWKLINHYMNMSKAWIPKKNTDKLEVLLKGQKSRWEFLATTGVLC